MRYQFCKNPHFEVPSQICECPLFLQLLLLPNSLCIGHDGVKITDVPRILGGRKESNAMNSTSSSVPTKTSIEVPRFLSN